MKVKMKYYKETRGNREYWTVTTWTKKGIFLAVGHGFTKEKAKQSAINATKREISLYVKTAY